MMAEKAYIGLNEENCWTLYYGDGTESEKIPLAVGRPFELGMDIQAAMAELEQWAYENDFIVDAPLYDTHDVSLETLIEPEVFDEVFGPYEEDEDADY